MRTLVIDTATKACSVALFDGEELVASAHEVIGRGHAERLLPLIAALPGRGKADRIFVDVGPGSFTGIRVGVAAAKALGLVWKVPVHGYGCLTLVAAMARKQIDEAAAIDVMMTGGHGEYFFEAFDTDGASISPVVSIQPGKVAELSQADTVAGDIDQVSKDKHYLEILPDASKWPLISWLPPLLPSPVYGRAPDAKPPKAALA